MYRYIGNKTKLLDEIINKTNTIIGTNGTVADLMAGTGCVSKALFNKGYNVIASDVMTYSKYHLISEIAIRKTPSFKKIPLSNEKGTSKYDSVINYLNNLEGREDFFFTEYSPEGNPLNGSPARKYFTPDNAKKIDAIRFTINEWIKDNLLSDYEIALLKHILIMSANEVANISGTFGYFLKEFSKSAKESINLKKIDFSERTQTNNLITIYQGYAEEISKKVQCDLCYIDPPYMKRQYAANYHILETLAVGDSPTDLIGKSGLRNWWNEYSNFCTKTKGLEAFKKIFDNIQCGNFLISYSEDGLFTIEQLEDYFSKFGTVVTEYITYQRFKSNNSKLPHDIKEYLITIRR